MWQIRKDRGDRKQQERIKTNLGWRDESVGKVLAT